MNKIKKFVKISTLAVLSVCAIGFGVANLNNQTAVAEDAALTRLDDTSISNTVWELNNNAFGDAEAAGDFSFTNQYGGEGEKSLLFTTTSTAAYDPKATVTSIQEYKNFDLYFDISMYQLKRNSALYGMSIRFGDGMTLRLPTGTTTADWGSYNATTNKKHPLIHTDAEGTVTDYASGTSVNYYWSYGKTQNSGDGTTRPFKLSVRDNSVALYGPSLSKTGEYNSTTTAPYNWGSPYAWTFEDGDGYSSEYGEVSVVIEGYDTKMLALSRLDIVPVDEDRTEMPAANAPDGVKNFATDQTLTTDLWTFNGEVGVDENGVNLTDGTSMTTVNEYRNFELIIKAGPNDGKANNFYVDFGDGVKFKWYRDATGGASGAPFLWYNGSTTAAIVLNTNYNYYLLTDNTQYLKLVVKDGVMTMYDQYNEDTGVWSKHNPDKDTIKDIVVNHSEFLSPGKITISSEIVSASGETYAYIPKVEIVNLDEKESAVTSQPTSYNDYTSTYDVTLDATSFASTEVKAVKLNGSFLGVDDFETVTTEGAVSGVKLSGAVIEALYTAETMSAPVVIYGNRNTTYATLTGWTAPTYKVIAMNGSTQVAEYDVAQGGTFTIPQIDTIANLVGWETNGDLYQAGKEVQINENLTVNAVCLDLSLGEGASVRISNSQNRNGGMRFEVMVNNEQLTALAGKVVLHGVLIPTDMINGTFDINETGSQDKVLENGKVTDGVMSYYMTLTDIKYYNFNRAYSAMAYAVITYADGATANFATAYSEENNSRSAYQVAVMAHNDTEEYAKYSQAQKDILDAYIGYTVVLDAQYKVATDAVEAYYTVEYVEGESLTITFTKGVPENYKTAGYIPMSINGEIDVYAVTWAENVATVTLSGNN